MFPRGQGPDPVRVTVTVECVGCKARKKIGPGEVKCGDVLPVTNATCLWWPWPPKRGHE